MNLITRYPIYYCRYLNSKITIGSNVMLFFSTGLDFYFSPDKIK